MLASWTVEPRLVYLNAGLGEGLTPRELARRRLLWDTREQERRGLTGLAVGHLAARAPALAYQWWPYPVVRRYLNACQMHLVLGMPLCGATPAVLGKQYVCWTATLLGDELRARAEGGEPWARGVLRSPTWPWIEWQERFVLKRAARILAVSQHTADRLSQMSAQIAAKVEVLSWPIDTGTFRPADLSSVDGPKDGLTLITVGRVDDPRKNIPALIEAMPLVQASLGQVNLRIVGPGAEALNLSDAVGVACLGRISHEDLVRELQQADLFVLPSLQEGLGLVVLEAMACGLPVVCTPSGGPQAHVRPGQTGWHTRDFSAVAIAETIIEALANPGRLQEMGQLARQVVSAENGREIVKERLRSVLEGVYHLARLGQA
jgi:glycosyltransferase involved in cell wall biosynthesis